MPYDQSMVVMPVGGEDVKIKYPGTLRAGLTYRPRNELATVFSVDVVRRFWEGIAADSYRTAAFISQSVPSANTWDVRFGLEHVFYNNVPARFGFRYLENYADPESNRSIFSGGVGYKAADYQIDVTLQYHRQTSRQAFIFDRTLPVDRSPGRRGADEPLESGRRDGDPSLGGLAELLALLSCGTEQTKPMISGHPQE